MRTFERLVARSFLTAVVLLALAAAPAAASSGHGVASGLVVPMAGLLSIFSGIGHAVLGAFSWTFHLAAKFILVTLGALVKLLIPRSWAREGVQVFRWIVAIPDYAGTITSPAGRTSYGFAGVNDVRQLFEWIGLAVLPLTLTYSTGRAMLGHGEPVAAPIVRVIALAGLLVSYAFWWAEAAALVNQLTNLILSESVVTDGIHKLMLYATEGVALGGWQLIDLTLMAVLAIELLALIFIKVVLILVGALLFATGPVMLGLVPTGAGHALARAWLSAVVMLLVLPVAWAAVFAIGAVLVLDAGTAGPLIGGSSSVGSLLGGVILAVTGAATLWLCLRAAREVGGLLRAQLGGLLVVARSHRAQNATAGSGTSSVPGRAASSIRGFQTRVRDAAAASMAAAGPGGERALAAAGIAGRVGRRGLLLSGGQAIGTAGRAAASRAGSSSTAGAARQNIAAAAATATLAAGPRAATVGRAGAVASRMARAGHASWRADRNVDQASANGNVKSSVRLNGAGADRTTEPAGSRSEVPRPRAGDVAAPASNGSRPPTQPSTRDGAPTVKEGKPAARTVAPTEAPPERRWPRAQPPRAKRGASPSPPQTVQPPRPSTRPAKPNVSPSPAKPKPSTPKPDGPRRWPGRDASR